MLCIHASADAALEWAGRTWNVTTGGMAGVAEGRPSNVTVDNDGYLHLKITKNGNTWTAAELFTTDKLGFGTYQWQIDAPLDRFDKNVVLGLYPYGPAAGIGEDGTNEIDIEYSFWGNADGVNGDWTDYPASGTTIGEKSYEFSLDGGTLSTSRFIWSTSKIENYLLGGLQPVGSTTALINSWTYAPSNSQVNIPQQALPLGINLWCFENPPSDGKDVEVVIRAFQFVAEGTSPEGSAGAGGTSGSAGATSNAGGTSSGGTSSGGASAAGALSSTAGANPDNADGARDPGCSCRVGPSAARSKAGWQSLLAVLLLGARRYRRRMEKSKSRVQSASNEH
ncbi:MAG: hypothetical protein ABW061_17230 [Polyangiaceae bacterium]